MRMLMRLGYAIEEGQRVSLVIGRGPTPGPGQAVILFGAALLAGCPSLDLLGADGGVLSLGRREAT